ncbi:MAG: 3-deoxy-manno-octulosonate cytidylyltransferase [Alphaproteobacteria bacterium]|nr:3-deoxy-manno-octulosonate cytidylyltransferase [Alphaproteobacteria bacterium]
MKKPSIAIIIPARYGSTRFPGKPLAPILGRAMVDHVYDIARAARSILAQSTDFHADIDIAVTSDDDLIIDHCRAQQYHVIATPSDCATGTDRVWAAAEQLATRPNFIINLQGDAPLTPPDFVVELIKGFSNDPQADIITPVVALTWDELDRLRAHKLTTPFSGTTAVLSPSRQAIWFSKQILPAMVKEKELRAAAVTPSGLSPVYRHIGLYGYRRESLQKYITLPPSNYEKLEGLEQLRAIENNMIIQAVIVDYAGRPAMTGVDSPEDLQRAEQLLRASRDGGDQS